jgi:hypothetical protein
VEGNILVDAGGHMVNVYRHTLDDALGKKEVRLFRNSTMKNLCYRYFVTSKYQLDKFAEERAWGSKDGPNKTYHVYVDEDVDRESQEYKFKFRLSRELDAVLN